MNTRKRRMAAEQMLYNLQQGQTYEPDVFGTKRKKMIRDTKDQQDEFEQNEDVFKDLESDAITTAEFLIKSNPKSTIPICFIHQIYSILPNNTMVDRELQQAFKKGTWRKFHVIGALEDEFVLLKTEDYCQMTNQAKEECIRDQDGDPKEIIKDVRYNEVSIFKGVLMKEFGLTEKNMSQLVTYGLLLPHIQMDFYWFSVRKQGSFMSNLKNGRIEILRILKRRHTKDIMEKANALFHND
ncbi:serine-threonine protein kinase 19-domain-containing protein [Cokeromyces recurvatus]|uniref:serine-threonine protein kinase 19-domain-containing protein n=1 Tax=Cokeromyces recurvatus TaxID=90255 RepID=UPI00221FEC9B|nr:serine-threonine protein kinase 19-domain-containing protein [Cokeromyces recurvatus]KAI7901489.1 serine-threonine protein kinase 19-domain-containing protein [Cokeromyces recurvatus]